MTIVPDASVILALLLDGADAGEWSRSLVASESLVAPHLMPVEVAHGLRRALLAKDVSSDAARLAHDDLLSLDVDLHPYEPHGERVWELRGSVTPYDAWYVAVAESIDAPLATLDRRLTRAKGPRCEFRLPTRR